MRLALMFAFCSTLSVLPASADLRITEVESSEAQGKHGDWWELSNFGSSPVDLSGYRFNVDTGGLTDPYTLPSGLSIGPGESIVLAEDLTADQFRTWWGASLSPSVQIVTYSGSGLSFSSSSDQINLWNATATLDSDTVASVSFGVATAGVTFTYNPVTGVFGGLSVAGVNGAYVSAKTGDIGSPGVVGVPEPSALSLAVLGLAWPVLRRCRR